MEPCCKRRTVALHPRALGILMVAGLLGACSGGPTSAGSPDSEAAAAPAVSAGTRDRTSVTVTWAAPVAGMTITGYELQWRTSSDVDWTTVTGIASTATGYTITGLQPQTTYEVRVRAVFGTTAGAWSEPITASTTPATGSTDPPPSNRPALSAPSAGASSITVTWTAPATTESITGYELQWRSSSETNWTTVTGIASTATGYTIAGLHPQTTYEVRVRVAFATIAGAWSESITASTTRSTGPADPPRSDRPAISQTAAGASSITVTWTAPATGESITGYELQWRLYFLSKWTPVTGIASTATSYTITGLQAGVLYDVRVRALHGSDAGRWSAALRCATRRDDSGPPFVSFFVNDAGDARTSEAHRYSVPVVVFYASPEYFPMTIGYRLGETGDMLQSAGVHTATIAEDSWPVVIIRVRLVDDSVDEPDSTVTATILSGTGYRVGTLSSLSFTATDDD